MLWGPYRYVVINNSLQVAQSSSKLVCGVRHHDNRVIASIGSVGCDSQCWWVVPTKSLNHKTTILIEDRFCLFNLEVERNFAKFLVFNKIISRKNYIFFSIGKYYFSG